MKRISLVFSVLPIMLVGCVTESIEMTEAESRFFLEKDHIEFQYQEGDNQLFVSIAVDSGIAHFAPLDLSMQTRWILPDGSDGQPERLVTKSSDSRYLYAMPMTGDGTYTLVVEEVAMDEASSIVAPGVTKSVEIIGSRGPGDETSEVSPLSCGTPTTIYGNNTANLLVGGTTDDDIYGYDGDDTLYGNDCADTLRGGKNRDLLFGGNGDDVLRGGNGTDVCHGEGGNQDQFYNCETIYP